MMFSSPQHPQGALDGEQDNGVPHRVMLSHGRHPQACPEWGAGLWDPTFNNAFPPSASSGCPRQGVGQWDPPLMMFSSPQHPWGALDGEQDNGILLLIMLSNRQHPQGAPDG